jgi:ABC-2 type transport system permease protein
VIARADAVRRAPSWFAQSRLIASAEIRRVLRDRSGIAALAIVLLLLAVSLVVTYERNARLDAQQRAYEQHANDDWAAQPDRHPHRVVHAGDFVFKPQSALAAIDWGVESHAGRAVFLEGHRQNTANFNEAAQSGALLRFGQLTPAMTVLHLLPLLLMFVGYATIASERQAGLLTGLLVGGARGRALVMGKFAALMGLAGLALLPLAIAMVAIAVTAPADAARAFLLLAVYAVYAALWCALIVTVSALSRSAYAALLILLCVWMVWSVLLPRAAPAFAAFAHPSPSRVETEIRAERALAKIGDSHNENDPYFAEFRKRTLAQYGVSRIEDLPVNYGGLVMLEGERLTSEIHARELARQTDSHDAQNRMVARLMWLAPSLAAATASRSLAGTDSDHHRDFVAAAEARRFAMVQALNRLHADKIRYENDRMQRLDAKIWRDIPRDDYSMPPLQFAMARLVPAVQALGVWLLLSLLGLLWCAKRLERGE